MFLYTAKIYNYDGTDYCFMGTGKLGKREGVLTLLISSKVLDESVTNRFMCIPDPVFCWRHKNEPMVISIGDHRQTVLMDDQIPFTAGGTGWQQYL